MQKTKLSSVIMAAAIMSLTILAITGCSEKKQPEPQTENPSENKPAATAPAADPRMIIQGFQSALEPAGFPLTEEQQKRITEVYNPATPDDMRPVYGVFTKEQKTVFVNTLREQLAQTKYPLTKDQETLIMSSGPGSKEKSWLEVFTPEQTQMMMGGGGQAQ